MSRMNAGLSNVEAIFHVQDQPLFSLDCLISHFQYFIEVVVLHLISVDLKNVFKSIQKVVECRLVLQNKQVNQVIDRAALMGQIFGQFV